MHKELHRLLPHAVGMSEWVVAINADVRGFSTFSTGVESSQAAVFLKRIYSKILDEYFVDATFFKPTGDGLLIIISYQEEALIDTLNNSVRTAIRTVEDFSQFCDDDPMINFEVPGHLGIGMARGAATRLHAEGKILDYSGRPLNLASRLMDFARPSGVVTDASFGIELLEDQLSEQFASQEVYIKSLAESSPASIQYTLNRTVIPSASTRPIQKIEWQEDHKNKTAKEIGQSRTFVHFLTKTPSDPDLIRVRYDFPAATKSGKRRGHIRTMEYVTKSTYSDEFGVPSVTISYAEISDALSRHAVKSTWDVNIYIRYPVK